MDIMNHRLSFYLHAHTSLTPRTTQMCLMIGVTWLPPRTSSALLTSVMPLSPWPIFVHRLVAVHSSYGRGSLTNTQQHYVIVFQAPLLNKGFWAKFEAWLRYQFTNGQCDVSNHALLLFTCCNMQHLTLSVATYQMYRK